MKMEKIKAALAALINEDNFETVTSDKGTLKWDGDEAIKVGDVVSIVAEDGTESSAEDGEYLTAELKIEIEGGAVKSIEEIEKEENKEATDEETVEEDNFAKDFAKDFAKKRVEAFELSYNERERKIYDAIREKLGKDEYFYLVEAGDNYAIVVIYDDDYNEKTYRYELEWDGNEVKVIGEAEEVKSAYIPVDEEAPMKEKTEEEGFAEVEEVKEDVKEDVKVEDVKAIEEKQDDAEERLKAIEDRLDKIEEALKNIEPAKAEEQFAAINNFNAESKKDERLKKMFNI